MSTHFRGGAQSRSHRPVSTPCPPNRDVRIARIRLSSGIMHLARGAPVRSHTRGTGGFACPRLPEAARLHPRGASPRRAAKPIHALTAPSLIQPGPFAYACDASELSAPSRGVRRQSHSRRPSSLRHPSTPEAPFLDGHYPASSVLRASPPPCRPSLPLAGFRLPRARHRQGFQCCYAFHLPCMPTPTGKRKPADHTFEPGTGSWIGSVRSNQASTISTLVMGRSWLLHSLRQQFPCVYLPNALRVFDIVLV